LEKEEFLNRLLTDLHFTASFSEQLITRPKALKEVIRDERIRQKLTEDPVFFAILMCNDKWLANAPEHQKLLRDTHPRQVAVCGRGWGKSLVFSRKNLWLIYAKPKIESLIISSTQRQSMIMFDYCYHTIQTNPLMRQMIKHPGTTRTTIRLKPPLNSRLVALPCLNRPNRNDNQRNHANAHKTKQPPRHLRNTQKLRPHPPQNLPRQKTLQRTPLPKLHKPTRKQRNTKRMAHRHDKRRMDTRSRSPMDRTRQRLLPHGPNNKLPRPNTRRPRHPTPLPRQPRKNQPSQPLRNLPCRLRHRKTNRPHRLSRTTKNQQQTQTRLQTAIPPRNALSRRHRTRSQSKPNLQLHKHTRRQNRRRRRNHRRNARNRNPKRTRLIPNRPLERRNPHIPKTPNGTKKPRHTTRRHRTNSTNKRTTIRIPTTQKSNSAHPPKILAPTTQTRRPTIRPSPRMLRQQRRKTHRHRSSTLNDITLWTLLQVP